jgi:Cu(I)/Ag(I) efflux system periplasmic protein CusF
MKTLLLTTIIALAATPAFATQYTIKEVTNPDGGDKPFYFSPNKLSIKPGDTVTFENAQDDMHDVMFVSVPNKVDEMIMSPMFEKKGDKFSYTFTVPGTYQFHCHPHEELGMKGTIIVGKASLPGETKSMDHEKLEASAATAGGGTAEGTGTINSVDPEKHTVSITHNPIKTLGWPKMKMQFKADNSVDLSALKPGESVSFTLKPVGKDDYNITKIDAR